MRIEQQNNILEMLQQNSGAEKGSNALFVEKQVFCWVDFSHFEQQTP